MYDNFKEFFYGFIMYVHHLIDAFTHSLLLAGFMCFALLMSVLTAHQ